MLTGRWTQHLDVGNAFFEVCVTDDAETEIFVKRLKVGLGADADGLAGVYVGDGVDGDLHDVFAESSAAVGLGGQDSADGGFGILFAGVDDAQVGGDFAVMQSRQVPGMGVVFVSVRAADVLLGDEDGLAGECDGVEFEAGKGFQSAPVEVDVVHEVESRH
ncbi:hypothetical protein RCF98_06310 [Thiothrix lacustris]|uniref:Uncharacterized protein n=1 Tax=Thiothrix lacustris TaxID=525917 RepID=A0ABY9MTF9_9GAMM|nr:hypothetical protein [Thiothrix lacustris]WML91949.1 hypothetical protein RCF98_06310 [Thiothrix lacustris]